MKLINFFKKVLAKHKLTYILLSGLVCIHPNIPTKRGYRFLIDGKEYIKLDNIPTLGDDELTRVLSPFINSEDIYGVLYEDAKINPLGVDGKPICVYNIRSTGILYIVNDNVIWADVKCLAKLSNMSYDNFIAKIDVANLYGEPVYANIKGIGQAIDNKDVYKEVFTMHVNLGDTGMYNGVLKIDGKLLPYIVAYGDVWVAGNTLADILEYKNIKKAINHVDNKYKCFLHYLNKYIVTCSKNKKEENGTLKNIISPIFNSCESNNFSPTERAVYVNREGVFNIINNSSKPIAKRIRENMIKVYAKLDNGPDVDVMMNLWYTELTPNLTEEIKASTSSGEPTKVKPPSDYSEESTSSGEPTKVEPPSATSNAEPTIKVPSPSDYNGKHVIDNILKKNVTDSCIYIFYTYHLDMDRNKLYKIGMTVNLSRRLKNHIKTYGCIDEIHIFPCIKVIQAEANCLNKLRELGALKNKLQCINGKNTKELLTIPEHMTYSDILNTLGSEVKATDDGIVSDRGLIEQEKTKQLELQVRLAEINKK